MPFFFASSASAIPGAILLSDWKNKHQSIIQHRVFMGTLFCDGCKGRVGMAGKSPSLTSYDGCGGSPWDRHESVATSLSLFTFTQWRRQWQPTPVFLPGESQGQQSLVGCCLWGRMESNTTEAT